MKKRVLSSIPMLFWLAACGSGTPVVTQPTVEISSPAAAVYTKGAVDFQVTVSGQPDKVELLKDGALFATLTAPYQFTWDTTTEDEGLYTMSARATKSGTATPAMSFGRRIIVDRTPPQIIASTPANGATRGSLSEEISLTFDEPLLPSSVNSTTAQLRQAASFASTASLDPSKRKLIFRPTVLPTLNSTIAVVLSGVTDRAGNAMSANQSFFAPRWLQFGVQPLDIQQSKTAEVKALTLDSNGNPFIAWTEFNGTSYNLYVKRWDGTAWVQVGSTFLNTGVNTFAYSSAELVIDSSNNPVVAWTEQVGVSTDLYVKRWDGTTWQQMGSTFLDALVDKDVGGISLKLNSLGHPVVAWDEATGGMEQVNVYVKYWDGTNWQFMGLAGASPIDRTLNDAANKPKLAIDPSGDTYVGWTESSKVYVARFNSINWETLGGTFIDTNYEVRQLILDRNNKLVVSYKRLGTTTAGVKRWDGTAWQTAIGSSTNMVLDSSNNPITVYSKPEVYTGGGCSLTPGIPFLEECYGGVPSQFSVFANRFDGMNWQFVEAEYASKSLDDPSKDAINPIIAIDANDNLTVAWTENGDLVVKCTNRIP